MHQPQNTQAAEMDGGNQMKGLFSFLGGIHPPHYKEETEHKPIEVCPAPALAAIPLQQHIGAPCEPLVKAGDTVKLGQKIGQPKGFVGAPVHASVSGKVRAIEPRPHPVGGQVPAVILENDGLDTMEDPLNTQPWQALTRERLKEIVLSAGLVGMGGATFPTHVKLSPPPDKKMNTVILNGAECEPYLTSDYRLMLEQPEQVAEGLAILMKILNVPQGFIGIEDNKPKAIQKMQAAVQHVPGIRVMPLKTKYPQGAEKQLIHALTKREVPSGGLPMDVGVVVNNVSTAAAAARAVTLGLPLFERIVTVAGGAVAEPKNLRIRIGTSYQEAVAVCGGLKEIPAKVISGGPMMGLSQYTLEVPVIKGTSGILLMTAKQTEFPEVSPCIRCARCMDVCPIHLMPLSLSAAALNRNYLQCETLHALDCIECGCCSYTCPAVRPLLQSIRVAKREIILSRKRSAQS